tara:strand:- start:30591 stop:31595 length:1005 start_codon:yes stop_codon:yes gene_type:complete
MSVIETLKDKIRGKNLRIIFPEGTDKRLPAVVEYLLKESLAKPIVLFADADSLNSSQYPPGTECLCTDDEALNEAWVGRYLNAGFDVSEKRLHRHFKNPLDAASIMIAAGGAEAMVGGLTCATSDVIMSGLTYIGLQEGISLPSSIFLMRIPGFAGSEGELMVFADCGVNPSPDSTELAQIGINSAQTANELLGWQARMAFLSFSTDGSAEHEAVNKVQEAVAQAQTLAAEKYPAMKIDGEFQLDAAISADVAAAKVKRASEVAGKANILIFPDLNAGNIAYKAAQRFAGADAYGPFLQGFRASISDLSRGSSVEDVIGVSVMALARAVGRAAQ